MSIDFNAYFLFLVLFLALFKALYIELISVLSKYAISFALNPKRYLSYTLFSKSDKIVSFFESLIPILDLFLIREIVL